MLTREEHLIAAFLGAIRKALPEYRERASQQAMIEAVSRTFDRCLHSGDTAGTDGSNLLVCESGTGTGKTFAYCVPGIVLAKSIRKTLIISTSTVALQEQLAKKDLPLLQRLAPFDFTFTVAKGRRRYACVARLAATLDDARQLRIDSAEPEEGGEERARLVAQMQADLEAGTWNGDLDTLREPVPSEVVERITTDRNGCTANRCAHFAQCPYYLARQTIKQADVVIANHDLVLAALTLRPGALLPDPADSFFVFDEGHVLPLKALSHTAHRYPVRASYGIASDLAALVVTAVEALGLDRTYTRRAQQISTRLSSALSRVLEDVSQLDWQGDSMHRFPNGNIPDALRESGQTLLDGLRDAGELMGGIRMDTVKASHAADHAAAALLPQIGDHLGRLDALTGTWTLMLAADRPGAAPVARWIEQTDDDYLVAAAPINAGDELTRNLWRRASAAVLTSATLTSGGRFDLFLNETGLRRFEALTTTRFPSPFDYAHCARIIVPAMRTDPTSVEQHAEEVAREIPKWLDARGILVLFTARKKMHTVFQALTDSDRARVLLQGALPKQELLRRHRSAIDRGGRSILFGLASFAEGVDLPGDYCTRVIITQLPFPVPTHPWEKARQEWVESKGLSAFDVLALPETGVKLSQSVGRLIRSESDVGDIIILDNRIATRRYGATLLRGLPPMPVTVGSDPDHVARAAPARP